MKTSIKILIAGVCLVLGVLVWYDLHVRGAYKSGSYKQLFGGFTTLNFKEFDEIDVNACTAANVIVKQGAFNIQVDPTASFVKVSRKGNALQINAVYPNTYYTPRNAYVLVITCPQLKKIAVDSRYTAGGRPVQDTLASENFDWRPSIIEGFNADSLSIVERYAGAVILKGNTLKTLNATLGIGDKSRSNMIILADNQLGSVNLDIRNRSQLRLQCKNIQNFKYQLADSARLIVNGAVGQLLKR